MSDSIKLEIEFSEENIITIRDYLTFRMHWITAGMGEAEPLDYVLSKILKEYERVKNGN